MSAAFNAIFKYDFSHNTIYVNRLHWVLLDYFPLVHSSFLSVHLLKTNTVFLKYTWCNSLVSKPSAICVSECCSMAVQRVTTFQIKSSLITLTLMVSDISIPVLTGSLYAVCS